MNKEKFKNIKVFVIKLKGKKEKELKKLLKKYRTGKIIKTDYEPQNQT